MKQTEIGSVAALYGCVGMTAPEAYTNISKMKCITTLVLEGATSLPLCDVAVVDTVRTLLICKAYLNSDMLVVVCDSAPALASLKHVIPYDYEGDSFSNFELKPPLKHLVIPPTPPIKIESSNSDQVREAVKSIIKGSILTEYNTLASKLNHAARKMLRHKMAELLLNKTTSVNLAQFLHTIQIDAEPFITTLNSRYFTSLRQAVVYHTKGHSVEYVMKKFNIKDSYEITYFARILMESSHDEQK